MNIYINDGKTQIPEDETCYIIAKGGIYLRKKLDLIESLTPIDKISFLQEIPVFAKLNIEKISSKMFGAILGFFKEIYRLYKSEAICLLFYNKDKKSYKIYVPSQEVSGASLDYKSDKTFKNHLLVGTIHSHSNMSAFHSSVDIGDEKNFDGIHFTVGKVGDFPFFDICASVVSNGLRIPVSPEDYIDDIEIREFTNYFPQMFRPKYIEINGKKIYENVVKSTIQYTIGDPSDENISFNKDWLNKVTEKVYAYTTTPGITRYTWKHGKLIKITEDNTNTPPERFLPYHEYQSILTPLKSDDKKDPCETCIYKNKKQNQNKDEDEISNMNDLFSPMSHFNEFE